MESPFKHEKKTERERERESETEARARTQRKRDENIFISVKLKHLGLPFVSRIEWMWVIVCIFLFIECFL